MSAICKHYDKDEMWCHIKSDWSTAMANPYYCDGCNKECPEYSVKTNYEKIKEFDRDELAKWIDKYGDFDGSSWLEWFDKKYCKNCEKIVCRSEINGHEDKFAWCELNNNKCKFFPELEESPDNREIIRMWLDEECDCSE